MGWRGEVDRKFLVKLRKVYSEEISHYTEEGIIIIVLEKKEIWVPGIGIVNGPLISTFLTTIKNKITK